MTPRGALLLAVTVAAALLSVTRAGRSADGFDIVSLGALGGIQDGNLSAYLVHPHDDDRAVTFDVGTLVNGLRVSDEKGAFDALKLPADSSLNRAGYVLTNRIKGYLVSHAHLDHVAGLVIASPDDSKKPIYALPSVNSALIDSYFNWQAWPNFSDRGKAPQLKKYSLENLAPGVSAPLQDTKMNVTAFPLSHGGVEIDGVRRRERRRCRGVFRRYRPRRDREDHEDARRLVGRGRQSEAAQAEGDPDRIVLHQRSAGCAVVWPPHAEMDTEVAARAR